MPVGAHDHLYVAKLERCGALSTAGRDALLALPTRRQAYAARRDIFREGDRPDHSCFVESGLVSRYKILRNGGRQIVSFHIPGDMVDRPRHWSWCRITASGRTRRPSRCRSATATSFSSRRVIPTSAERFGSTRSSMRRSSANGRSMSGAETHASGRRICSSNSPIASRRSARSKMTASNFRSARQIFPARSA